MIPLQPLVNNFLLNYHLGHVLLFTFAVTTLGALPLKSQRVIAVNLVVFGLIFAVAPFSTMSAPYILFGLVLIVVGPLLWTMAE
ncbi:MULTISPECIES: hypothetical protein [Halopenitus]|uniref:DUF8006 domain-containing protein n=1 Tax=Halopenitus malekzadehii TaxID=1267564 RepID=A0A1H6J7G7_9EURY|nr:MULTISPECIES: hypothetical protein [Halopenitus]SEH58129.1 hypothetical protein SAMN05192561_10923 [Halopenitus malekzadehii]